MSWLKKKLRRWLNSENEISIPEDRAYATAAHHNMGESQTSVQIFRAMNGTVLVMHSQNTLGKNLVGGRQAGPTIYVLKEGESIQDAVATLLVKARLDSM
jgi:hypothetical protein